MYLFHAQSTLSRRSSVQQPVVGVWSCENKVRKRVEVKSKILQSSTKKALKTSLLSMLLRSCQESSMWLMKFSKPTFRGFARPCKQRKEILCDFRHFFRLKVDQTHVHNLAFLSTLEWDNFGCSMTMSPL